MIDPSLTIRQLGAAFRERRLSIVELVKATLDAASANQASLNAFVSINSEQALLDAQNLQAELDKGHQFSPLHGIPFTVKDTIATSTLPTGMGTAFFSRFAPRVDAVPVAALRDNGAVLIGKTTTSEFGLKAITEGPAFGATRNPLNTELTVGGSSGGSAASIAAGIGSISLVTDGGGSARIPAACTGTFGIKTTFGAVTLGTQSDAFTNQIATGLIARHPDDLGLGIEFLAHRHCDFPFSRLGDSVRSLQSTSLNEAVIACTRTLGFGDNHTLTDLAFDETVTLFESRGAKVRHVDLDLRSFAQSFEVLMVFMPVLRLSRLLRSNEDKADPFILSILEEAARITARDVALAEADRSRVFAKVDSIFRNHHALLVPTLRHPPPRQEFYKKDYFKIRDLQTSWYANCFPFNLSGHPAVSFPTNFISENVPVAMQLAGPWLSDLYLLRLVEELDATAPVKASN